MRLKAPLRQYGLKEPLKVDVFVLNRAAVLLAIVEGEPEREAILENGGEHETDSTGSGFLTSAESRVRKTAAGQVHPDCGTNCSVRSIPKRFELGTLLRSSHFRWSSFSVRADRSRFMRNTSYSLCGCSLTSMRILLKDDFVSIAAIAV
jgi:hypothetical protein